MRPRRLGYFLSLWAVAGIISRPVAAAETVARGASSTTDVTLDAEGNLAGSVVDSQGQRIAGVPIFLSAVGGAGTSLKSDEQGRFRAAGLRGGLYHLSASDRTQAFRLWTPAAAPPGSQSEALLVVDRGMARGQTPIPDYFRSDAVMIAAVIIMAIAIPIAIHNFRNDHPSSS